MNESDLTPYSARATIGEPPVLVLAPHPDDEVLGCGGAILSHVAAHNTVDVVIVTDGCLGLDRPGLSQAQIVELRAAESRCAARILGYGQPEFWGEQDRGLCCDETLITRIVDVIDQNSYRTVFAPSPLEIHPDHAALASACIAAAERSNARFELCFYEVGQPLHPNCLLDISAHFESKQRAIACFTSQLSVQNYDVQNAGLNQFRTYTLPPDVSHAEGYLLLTSTEAASDRAWCGTLGMPRLGRPDWDRRLRELAWELTTSEQECRRLSQRLAHLETLRSWRVTRPLRSMRAWLGAYGKRRP